MGDGQRRHAWAPETATRRDVSSPRGRNGSGRVSAALLGPSILRSPRRGVAGFSRIGPQIWLAQKHGPGQRDRTQVTTVGERGREAGGAGVGSLAESQRTTLAPLKGTRRGHRQPAAPSTKSPCRTTASSPGSQRRSDPLFLIQVRRTCGRPPEL